MHLLLQSGVALEDMKYIFEGSVTIRALQDAPGGRMFLGGKRAATVEELRARDVDERPVEADNDDDDRGSRKGGRVVENENVIYSHLSGCGTICMFRCMYDIET
jgi:hypothetical protein